VIIVKLQGGLANQLFQYAIGRKISINLNAILKLDIEWFSSPNNAIGRNYGLSAFNISENFATAREINKYTDSHPLILSAFNKLLYRTRYIKEAGIQFSKEIFDTTDNTYLEGYWQSEKYFIDIREILLKDFSFRNEPDTANIIWLDRIHNSNSVSVHIRRGDYANIPSTNKFHGLCDPEYYTKACKVIETRQASPEYFVFSDDINWAKENIHFSYPAYFIGQNSSKPHEDLRLMTHCKHNIIANSSFSWWGAWLNTSQGKIVIAPRKWFNDPEINTLDLVPESWLRL
jgi:hypothetical protein